MSGLIDPRERIAALGVEQFCASADRPFAGITDPLPLMAKPFGNLVEAPDNLYNLGLLLFGLRLGRTLRVLDFGAGTCWLSRCFAQLGCATVSVDPSPAALAVGKRLFSEHPPLGGCVAEPVFLQFNGRRIELPDASVDRVVCFDSFHHVPNQREVIAEFARVLRPGGIAGFSEPGLHHSRSAASQHEMHVHDVLENDIDLKQIRAFAEEAGFTDLVLRHAPDPQVTVPWGHYRLAAGQGSLRFVRPRILWSLARFYLHLFRGLTARSVFTLHKGPFSPDTRLSFVAVGGDAAVGGAGELRHRMAAEQHQLRGRAQQTARVRLRVANLGSLTWLHENIVDYAIVKIGGHLLRTDGSLVDYDFLRCALPHAVPPGGEAVVEAAFTLPGPGSYTLALDMVSERVVWFEAVGSEPLRISLLVD